MHTGNLRKVGGSVMLAVPPAILDMLRLRAGGHVTLSVEKGRLVVDPVRQTRYSLEELLAQCDQAAPVSAEDKDWTASGPLGRELL